MTIAARLFLVFISLFINCTYGIRCQTVFDIYVDEIYLDDDDDLYFFKRGEKTNYDCEVVSLNQGDYLKSLALDCDEAYIDPEERNFFNPDSILKFSTHSEFIAWLKDQSFEAIPKYRHRTEKNVIQFFNQHLLASASFYKSGGVADWEFKELDFWDYVYFRVNDSFLILGLVYENDGHIGGWLIPTLDGGYLKTDLCYYTSREKRIKLDSFESHRYKLQSFIRSENRNEKYLVKDKLFDELIRPDTFDHVKIGQRYSIEKIGNQYQIYDLLQDSVILKGLMAAHDSLGFLQFIKNDRIQWMDYQGHVHDTMPRDMRGLCGTIWTVKRKISKQADSVFIEASAKGYYSADGDELTGHQLLSSDIPCELKYLNDDVEHSYNEYSGRFMNFSLPFNYYMLRCDGKEQVLEIKDQNDSLRKALNRQMDYAHIRNNVKADSIDNLLKALQPNIKVSKIFEGNLTSYGYFHPILFKKEGLYGYYPLHDEAIYKELDKFIGEFARMKTADGRTGWIDTKGNEYFNSN